MRQTQGAITSTEPTEHGMPSGRPESEHPLRVLIVEDDSAYAELTKTMLLAVGSLNAVLDYQPSMLAAVESLAEQAYDVVLLDLGLPDASGLEALGNLSDVAPDVPLVILSANEDVRLAIDAVKAGAQDYLIKGEATPELLVRAIRYAIERKQLELQIRHLAYYDSLTLLPNRRLLMEHLTHALRRAARTRTSVGVLFIDLDHFKQINDVYGHAVGDRVLTQVANRLSKSLRRSDTLGRLGGDEFLAIIEVGAARELSHVADSLRRSLKAPFTAGSEVGDLRVTASVGISSFPVDSRDVGELLRFADHAMYRAKVLGRDRVFFHAPPPPRDVDTE
jgi:diguanylate cyclase (GGDEF)-like protein